MDKYGTLRLKYFQSPEQQSRESDAIADLEKQPFHFECSSRNFGNVILKFGDRSYKAEG